MTGVVDDYLPGHGDPNFAVLHYDLTLDYTLDTNHLKARATLRCRSLASAERIHLDLHGLRVAKVTVDAQAPRKYRHRGDRLVVQPHSGFTPGQEFTVVVTYSGHPSTVPGPDGGAGWEELTDGLIVAGQPDGAPSWFPCNDRVADKASYRFEVSTPVGYRTIANGCLVRAHTGSSRTVWVYEQHEPMSTYLATLQIGRYRTTALGDSPVPMLLEAPPRLAGAAGRALARQAEMLLAFTAMFGAYPFPCYTVVVTDDELEIPLESQTLSTFGPNHLRTDWEGQRLIAHELSHQWFGNAVTAHTWRDIWLHEGFACYSEWLWSETSGGPTAHRRAEEHWRELSLLPQDLILADPSRELMFDDRVYKRGALLLHALRLTLGDPVFFDLLRRWVADHLYQTVTSRQFVDHVTHPTGPEDGRVRELLTSWLYSARLPPLPKPSRT